MFLKNSYFVAFVFSNFISYKTVLMPSVYMADRAIESGLEKAEAALVLSMHGAGNLLGWLGFSQIARYSIA